MARATNGPGAATARAVQKTITVTREVLPAAENSQTQQEEDPRDVFEFMDSIPPEEWERDNYNVYLFRVDPKTTRGYGEANLGCFSRPISLSFIRETFGGQTHRVLVKRGAQRVFDKRIVIELPPKYQTGEHSPTGAPLPQPAAVPTNEAGAVAMMGTKMVDAAGQMVGNQPAVMQAMMGVFQDACAKATQMVISQIPPAKDPLEVLKTAKEILAPPPAPAASTGVPAYLEGILTRIIERVVAPPDPIKTFSDMVDTIKRSGLMGRGERTDMALEAVRQLPVVTQQVTMGIHEWRLGVEAQRDKTAIEKGAVAGTLPTAVAVNAPAVTANSGPTGAPTGHGPSLEWIESKIVEIVSDVDLTPSEAAEEAIIYLDRESPVLVRQLITLGEQGIIQLFQSRPTLQVVPQNQRLTDFIRLFLELAKEPPIAPGPPEGTPPA